MKLIDPETNKEYEFEETHFVSSLNGDYQRGTLKPVDSWPKGFTAEDIWDELDGVFNRDYEPYSKEETEQYEAEDEAKGREIIKKYLKAWEELQDE